MTIYKPLQTLARGAAELAVRVAERRRRGRAADRRQRPRSTVPAVLLDVVTVTRDNLVGTVVADGQATYEDVYRGIPESDAARRAP